MLSEPPYKHATNKTRNTNFAWLGSPRPLPDVPLQPWNHSRRFWHESHRGTASRYRSDGRKDLVGVRSDDSSEQRSTWNHFLRLHENPWIKDHKIQKIVLYPAAGMVAMAVEGFSQVVSNHEDLAGFYLQAFAIEHPMVVPKGDHGLEVSMVLTNLDRDDFEHSFEICSKHLNGKWQKNASGRIMLRRQSDIAPFEFAQYRSQRASLEGMPHSALHPTQLYAAVEDQGLNYGPMFRNITSAKVIAEDANGRPACLSTIRAPDTKSKMPRQFEHPHFVHPATLDSMIQTLFALYPTSMIPTGVDKIWISAQLTGKAGQEFEGYSTGVEEGTSGALGTIAMTTDGWDVPSVVMDGARFTKMARLPVEKGGHIPVSRNLTSRIDWKEDVTSVKFDDLEKFLSHLAHKFPGLSVLQVGLDASMTYRILQAFHPRAKERCLLSRFTLSGSDGGSMALGEIQELLKDSLALSCIEARKYPTDSGEEFPQYNLIVSDCTSADMLRDFRKRLLPDGFFLQVIAGTKSYESIEAVSCYWQRCEPCEVLRCSSLNLRFRLHRKKAEIQGHPGREVAFLIPDKPSAAVKEMTRSLFNAFQDSGVKVINLSLSGLIQCASEAEPSRLFKLDDTPCVSFLSAQEDNDFVFNWTDEQFKAFKHLLKNAKSILWLTKGVYMDLLNPKASLIVGLARTLMSEDPEKNIVTLDTSGKGLGASWAALCLDVFKRSFFADVLGPRDVEYSTDGKRLFIPRLRTLRTLNRAVEGTGREEVQNKSFAEGADRFKLVLNGVGSSKDPSQWENLGKYEKELSPKEVEVQFVSAPLLREDFETALGHTTLTSLGLDICGRVTKAGKDVHDLKKGDLVVGISLQGAFQSRIRLDRGLVCKVPGNDTLMGSKLLLSCYLSAWYAIEPLTQNMMERKLFGGKTHTVLVHNVTSAHGQAAVVLAEAFGLEVYATAGSNTKEAVRELGIQEDHIIPLTALSHWGGNVDIVYDPMGSFFSKSAQHAKLCECPFLSTHCLGCGHRC